MTQDEIIRMMKEAGFYIGKDDEFEPAWERFAALVAAHEREKCFDAAMKAAEKAIDTALLLGREACAKVCERIDSLASSNPPVLCAAAIRARGEK